MIRALAALLPFLGATPALAQTTASSTCNGQAVELFPDGRLTLNGEDVPVEAAPGAQWYGLVCQSNNGRTVFGLIGSTDEGEVVLLLDPATRELRPATPEEAQALGLS